MNDLLKNIIKQFMPFAQKQLGFKDPPRLFLRNDSENAKNPFGKTAYYDPAQKSVTLYITGRHPKDILRSLGHELVHHKQNCDGHFDNAGDTGPGYAQKDPHLRQMEIEANRDGSMCLRDFEDMLKQENTIYYEHLQKGENKMSTKDWKNKEVTQLLAEAWGFKFNTLQEFEDFNGTGELQAEGDEEIEEAVGQVASTRSSDRRTPRGVGSADARRRGDSEEESEKDSKQAKRKMAESEEDINEDEEVVEESAEDIEEQSRTDSPDRVAGRDTAGRRLDEEDEEVVEENEEEVVEESEEESLQESIAKILRKHLKG